MLQFWYDLKDRKAIFDKEELMNEESKSVLNYLAMPGWRTQFCHILGGCFLYLAAFCPPDLKS